MTRLIRQKVNKGRVGQALTKRMLWHFLEIDEDGVLLNPPQNDEELSEFIRLALVVDNRPLFMPDKRITPDHATPFQFVADLFFERVRNAIGFANRSGGKTLATAVLNFLDMFFKRNCEIASFGAVLQQAEKCYRYFKSFLTLPWFVEFKHVYQETVGRAFIIKELKSETEFDNGSTLHILTGTEKGLRSPHPNKCRIDEVDEMPWSLLQTGLSMAAGNDDVMGQNVFTSTRQHDRGAMQRLMDQAEEKGIKVYQWDTWEILERCDRRCKGDAIHGDCPVYGFCQGKAHHCAGFYRIPDFIDKVRLIDRITFETEWLNKRPSRHRLVYDNFDNVRHLVTPARLRELTGCDRPQGTWYRIGGIDFGSSPGHPFVYVQLCQLPRHDTWMIEAEYVLETGLMRDHGAAICGMPHWQRGTHVYADWDAQDRKELKAEGVSTKPAIKHVLMGINYVRGLLEGPIANPVPQLFVWHECKHAIEEFGLYSWPVRPDGAPDKSGMPRKDNDHVMDAVRYALFTHRNRSKTMYRMRRIEGI